MQNGDSLPEFNASNLIGRSWNRSLASPPSTAARSTSTGSASASTAPMRRRASNTAVAPRNCEYPCGRRSVGAVDAFRLDTRAAHVRNPGSLCRLVGESPRADGASGRHGWSSMARFDWHAIATAPTRNSRRSTSAKARHSGWDIPSDAQGGSGGISLSPTRHTQEPISGRAAIISSSDASKVSSAPAGTTKSAVGSSLF